MARKALGTAASGVTDIAALQSVTPRLGMVNVKDYGATGNGSTNDTTAIANAYTAAAGRPLFFPNGTYLVTALPALQDGDRLVGAGYESIIKYAGTGTLLPLTGKQDIALHSLDIWITGVGAKAIDLSACFQVSLHDVRIRGAHDGTTGTTYRTQKGLIVRDNSGNTRVHNCIIANLGIGIESACIQSEVTNSKIVTCWNSVKGIGGAATAGMVFIGCEFISDTDPDSTSSHVDITGSASTWYFSGCWFEGSDYGLIVGVFGSGGPSSFTMVGCKVAARSVGIQMNHCRQPSLIACEFNVDAGGTMTEIVFGGTPAGDEVIEGVAFNLVTTIRSDFADTDFPQYWNVFRRGSFRSPNITSTSNVSVDGEVNTGNLQVRNDSPAAGKVLTALDTNGNAAWATPDVTQAELDSFIASAVTELNGKLPVNNPTATGLLTTPAFKVTGGTPAAGKTLISDADGDAVWGAIPWESEIYLNSVPIAASYTGYSDNDGGVIISAPNGVLLEQVVWRLSAPAAVIGGSGNFQIQWYLGSPTAQETTLISTTQVAAGQHDVTVTFGTAQTCTVNTVLRAKITSGTTTLPSKSSVQWRGRYL